MNRPELLAPAGSMDALRAAVNSGADAVYLGVGMYNARANAQNFAMEELPEAISYAHLHSVLLYLTLNTLLRDDELQNALQLAVAAYEMGVDALIVQDVGLTHMLHTLYPHIPLHASTQMNLFDLKSLEWAKNHHIVRIVLPRELSFDEIHSRTLEASSAGIETEVFIHGALCISYSGLCLFSAMNGNGMRSGNRGLCAQPCRTRFRLMSSSGMESEPARLLSPKDQSALSYLPKLIKAGVASFKIEGRMRETAYVAATVRAYREYLDEVIHGTVSAEAKARADHHLRLAFNRGGSFTSQYMQGAKKGDLLSGDYSGRYGVLLGIVVKRNARIGTLTLRHDAEILPVRGDYLSIRSKEVEIASFPIGSIEKIGDVIVVKGLHPQMIDKIPDGASVFQMSETMYTKDLHTGKAAYKTPISMRLQYSDPTSSSIILSLHVVSGIWADVNAAYVSVIPEHGTYPELSDARISDQLSKSKSSPFDVVSMEVAEDISLRVPVSYINELRRESFSALEQAILSKKHPTIQPCQSISDGCNDANPTSSLATENATERTINSSDIIHVNYFHLQRILPRKLSVGADYYSFSVFDLMLDECRKALHALLSDEPDARILIWLPGAYKDAVAKTVDDALQFMKKEFPGSFAGVVSSHNRHTAESIWISSSANLFNSASMAEAVSSKPFAVAPSYELKDREIQELLLSPFQAFSLGETFLSLHRYGRIEWMQSEFCPVGKHVVGCRKCNNNTLHFSLRMQNPDDTDKVNGKILPVITHAGPCSSEILGQNRASVGEELLQTCKNRQIRVAHTIRFLDESLEERIQIIQDIKDTSCLNRREP